jgi:hypothetical protein
MCWGFFKKYPLTDFSSLKFSKTFLRLMSEKISMMVLWAVMPCGLVCGYQHFGAFLGD